MRANYASLLYSNGSDFTALGTFTSEASLLGGSNQLPAFPALWFDGQTAIGKGFELDAMGVVSSTGAPTYTFTVRLGPLLDLTGTAIAVSAAITAANGITNKWWRLFLRAILRTPGQGAGNSTFSVAGFVESPGGFATPFQYALEPTTPDTATWTVAPVDSKVQNYLNLSVACGTSNAANAIRCKDCVVRDMG